MDLIEQVLVDWTPKISISTTHKLYCNQCNHRIIKQLYSFGSDFNLCKSCYQFPNQIHHWLHTQHRLVLQTKQLLTTWTTHTGYDLFCFICDGCFYVSFGRVYVCQDCEFRCCVECSVSTSSRMPIEWKHSDKSIFHYSHLHELTRCRYKRRLDSKNRDCLICELPLWGICYGCVRCAYFIHETCVGTRQQILHPIHTSHPLSRLNYAQDSAYGDVCNGCTDEIWEKKHFFCEKCDFNLHLNCADSLLRTIKHERHPHDLLYRTQTGEYSSKASCGICKTSVSKGRVSFYRCVECDLTFHFECVPIPPTFKHRYHMHPLSLVYWLWEGGYACSICELPQEPGHAYRCRKCKFLAHIECVLSKEDDSPKFLSSLSLAAAYTESSSVKNDEDQIQHMSHKHELKLSDVDADLKRLCKMCNLEIQDPAYACQECEFWVHKKCVDLPQELDHPLHGCRSLTLLKNFRFGNAFICNICRDVSDTFCFLCRVCGYIIDVKCAFATQHKDDSNGHMEHERELVHPVFGSLQLVNPTGKFASMSCKVCNQKISGLRYSSLNTDVFERGECEFFHDNCIKLPLEVEQHTLHPNHHLSLARFDESLDYCYCRACRYRILAFGYRCREKCRFFLHVECAHSLSRLMKHEAHVHPLYYFHRLPSNIGLELNDTSGHNCSLCGLKIKTKCPYYRCVKCWLNFHLKCLRLPRAVKHKWHLHQLNYKKSVDFGGCYCDICEEERDLRHPAYCCEDCKFVAHVDCIVSEENGCNVVIEEIESQDAESSGSDASEETENEDTDRRVAADDEE